MHETAVEPPGVLRIGVLGLLRERIGIQPRQQLQVQRKTQIAVLRRMNVQVVKSRDKQFVTEVNQLATPVKVLRQLPVHALNEPVGLDDDIAVLDDLQYIFMIGVS